ncbi:MAG: glutathione S-transferase [Gammaproteobacteria bacterium TMED226]|nr:MAG: glutathione S-transferase [Gammaproteobacteria bacterium TMED226]|tara:strand:+ start:984 stop:1637 length:654 start_codon:yes stop_codon:yes gene_type:complete
MKDPILYSFKRCPYAMRARMALKLANIKCEIREIRLNNKPDHMLKVSPKGTVPILILDNKVIDESMDIINWALNKVDVFKGNIEQDKVNLTKELVTIFDDKFKYHLDRYKYSTRYKDANLEFHRSECLEILYHLESVISNKKWCFGDKINKLDISILPFIRQFRIASPSWFDSQKQISNVQKILKNFLDSKLFKEVMHVYEVWEEESALVYFPPNNL